MLIRGAEIEGRAPLDVRIAGDRITAIGSGLEREATEDVHDAAGGALLPGLHDHHIHLFALAATAHSVRCGPPEVRDAAALAAALHAARGNDWIRGIGYHESVAGDLDRARLDALVPDRPLRIQHRSGMLWVLNSAAIAGLGLERGETPSGAECDPRGRLTGRLFRLDAWLRERLGSEGVPSLRDVGRQLAAFGVTGVTDATAGNDASALAALTCGELPQRLLVMGGMDLPELEHPAVSRGALKLVLDEHALPSLEEIDDAIARAHRAGRMVAIHCVTHAALILAAAALREAGARAGDRIEHASVAPPAAAALLAELGVTVVTQPGFVRERGDAYLADVPPDERPWLYRCRGFLAAGIPLGAGTDAPFGDPNPWLAMQAAVDRRTLAGHTLGAEERLTPEEALALFTSPPESPGAAPRRITVGAPADLCLLDSPWSEARRSLGAVRPRATIVRGAVV